MPHWGTTNTTPATPTARSITSATGSARAASANSYRPGDWHVIHLNDNINYVSISAGSAQDQWLVADLRRPPNSAWSRSGTTPLFLFVR